MTPIDQKSAGEAISVEEFNTLGEAANAVLGASSSGGAQVTVTPSGLGIDTEDGRLQTHEPAVALRVVNDGATDIRAFDAVRLTTTAYDGHVVPDSWDSDTVIWGRIPDVPQFGRFGIALEKIPADSETVGRVAIAGVVPCRVKISDREYIQLDAEYADTVPGEGYLQLSEKGGAQVLWIEGNERNTVATHSALVRMAASRNVDGVGVRDWAGGTRGIAEVLIVKANSITRLGPGLVMIV